jgi:hypothetical protein
MMIVGSGFRIPLLLVMAEMTAGDTTTSTAGAAWADEAPQHVASGRLHQQHVNALLVSQSATAPHGVLIW